MKQTFKFKTNINCSGCVAQAKPALDATKGIERWEVDTDNRHKILTVIGEGLSEQEIVDAVKLSGFKIESEQS
jgi:copper chaperone